MGIQHSRTIARFILRHAIHGCGNPAMGKAAW
jgi:hypothetical protein